MTGLIAAHLLNLVEFSPTPTLGCGSGRRDSAGPGPDRPHPGLVGGKLGRCLSGLALAIDHRAGFIHPCRAAEFVLRIELHQLLG